MATITVSFYTAAAQAGRNDRFQLMIRPTVIPSDEISTVVAALPHSSATTDPIHTAV